MLVACEDDLDVEEDALEDGPSSASEAMPHQSLPGRQAEGEGGQLTTRLSEMALTNHDDATLEISIRPEEMMTPRISSVAPPSSLTSTLVSIDAAPSASAPPLSTMSLSSPPARNKPLPPSPMDRTSLRGVSAPLSPPAEAAKSPPHPSVLFRGGSATAALEAYLGGVDSSPSRDDNSSNHPNPSIVGGGGGIISPNIFPYSPLFKSQRPPPTSEVVVNNNCIDGDNNSLTRQSSNASVTSNNGSSSSTSSKRYVWAYAPWTRRRGPRR